MCDKVRGENVIDDSRRSDIEPITFVNGRVILPDRIIDDGMISCEDGMITRVGPRTPHGKEPGLIIDAHGGYLAPGFVDLHVHGGGGSDFMDGTEDAVCTVIATHARHGTTTIFPTTTTGSQGQIREMLAACAAVQHGYAPAKGARIAGVHFYGPYFAEEKVGCHSRQGRRNPDPEEYRAAFAQGTVRIATCAAELPGAVEFYSEARRNRCLVTCGHSNATWSEMKRAYEAGMRHVDHFWCAMSSVTSIRERCGTPMQGSMEQFVLAHPEVSTEVIADGRHLSPELLDFAFQFKGPHRLCLVTDANRAVDMPPGEYRFGPQDDGEWFTSDGLVGFQPDAGLASSVVGLDAMVRNMTRMTSAGLVEAVRMASLTPAARAGVDHEVGSLTPGKSADVLVLDGLLNVSRVFIGGVEVSR